MQYFTSSMCKLVVGEGDDLTRRIVQHFFFFFLGPILGDRLEIWAIPLLPRISEFKKNSIFASKLIKIPQISKQQSLKSNTDYGFHNIFFRLLLWLSGISTCQCCRLAVTPGNTSVKHDNIFRYSFQIPSSSL